MSENKHPVRVCFLIAGFHPLIGGGENHALQLSRALRRKGADVRVLTRQARHDLPPYERVQDVPVYRVLPRGFMRWGKYIMLFPALTWLCAHRKEYDIIYVCALRVLGWTGVMAAALLRKRCILRAEAYGEMSGAFIWNPPGGHPLRRVLMVLKPLIGLRNLMYRRADVFLAVSDGIRREFLDCGVPEDKTVMIPNGIDMEKCGPLSGREKTALRERMHLPESFIFAYAGKLNRGKGLEMLLRAWERFKSGREHVHLLLIGSGGGQYLSCEDELKKYVNESGLGASVTFTGYVHDVYHYLQASDFFVFPSERETFGLAPLEAMACGLPVISTRCGIMEKLIKDEINGLLIDVGDEAALVRKMEWALAHREDAAKMAYLGRESVLARYSIDAVADAHMKLFRQEKWS